MTSRRTTLLDVAKVLGVSHTTVALALKNHHRISKTRCLEVQRMAKKMGYQPDPFLSGLAAYRKMHGAAKFQGLIAWVDHWDAPKKMRQFREFEGYWLGAAAAAKRVGYQLQEIRWPQDYSADSFERILRARGVHGLLLPPHHAVLDWEGFDWSKFSTIRFGLSVQSPDANLVSADHMRAIVMAIEKIHSYGYRRIGLIAGKQYDRKLGGSFTGGYCHQQIALKLQPALLPLLTDYGSRDAAGLKKQSNALLQWLKKHQPDAVLTTDAEIPGLIKELGYRIPKDIAVAGTTIYDIPVDTGIDQHPEAIGRIAMEMLVKQINMGERGEPEDPCRILVESRWQDGKSLPRRHAG
jgi:DNA-binding LacI/PurR family transcriptional regulator